MSTNRRIAWRIGGAWFLTIAMLAVITLFTMQARSQDKSVGGRPKNPDRGSRLDQALHKAAAAGTPGAAHRRLDEFVGAWDGVVRAWSEPGAVPQVSKCNVVRNWILDGRILHQDYDGEAEGKPFRGLALVGHDNAARKYFCVWCDSRSTGVMMQTGEFDANGRTLTFTGEVDDPAGSGRMTIRSTLRMEGETRHVEEVFKKGADGREFRAWEIVLTRR